MKTKVKQLRTQFSNSFPGICSVLLLLAAMHVSAQVSGQTGVAQQSGPVQPSPVSSSEAPSSVSQQAARATQTTHPFVFTPAPRTSPPPPVVKSAAFTEVSESEGNGQLDSAAPSDGASQGIKVHGHWVIDVRDPDGTLVTHREFENSLTGANQGQLLLGGLLSGYYVAGGPAIVLGTNICSNYPGGNCVIVTSDNTEPGIFLCGVEENACSPGLQITYNLAPTTGNGAAYMVMTGTGRALSTGTLDKVATVYSVCDAANNFTGTGTPVLPTGVSTLAPSACFNSPNSANLVTFTKTKVSPAINVTRFQYISVQVTISFS